MSELDTARIARAIREIPEVADALRPMIAAMNKAALALTTYGQHMDRHHAQERPEISAMHTAYDHRRKARRARRRT